MYEFIKKTKGQIGINFFCTVTWLSSYNVLNRFVDLFDQTTAFIKEK